MNLISAIKSGKRFKRPMWRNWVSAGGLLFSSIDALADDFILEDSKPKRRLYINRYSLAVFDDGPPKSDNWKLVTKADWEALFGDE